MALRPATALDAPDLARINRRARAGAMPWLTEPRSEAEVEGWLRRYLIPRERVLCTGGEPPLGYIGFGREGDGWSVHDLYIDPVAQGGAMEPPCCAAPWRRPAKPRSASAASRATWPRAASTSAMASSSKPRMTEAAMKKVSRTSCTSGAADYGSMQRT